MHEQYLMCLGIAALVCLLASLPVAIVALVLALKALRQVKDLSARRGVPPEAASWLAAPTVRKPARAPAAAVERETPSRPAPAMPAVSPAAPAAGAEKPPAAPPPVPPQPPRPPGTPAAAPPPAAKPVKWEELIGLKVLAWAGIIVFLVGVAFFIKYGYEQGWFGRRPWVRVAIPTVIGLVFLGLGEFLSARKYRVLARCCTGGGLAALYWAVFTAWARLKEPLICEPIAWALMTVITAVAILLAVRYASMVVGILSLVGGLAAPLLIRPERDPGHVLFLYLLALNLGVLVLAYFKKWRVLNLVAFAGTALNVIVWLYSHYWVHGTTATEKLGFIVTYLTVLWATYFALLIVYHLVGRRDPSHLDLPLTLVNVVAYYLGLYALLKTDYHHWLGPAAVILAAVYLAEGLAVKRGAPAHGRFALLQIGQALGLLTLAIPIQLNGLFIPMAWAVEGCVLYWMGVRLKDWRLRVVALIVHAISVGALLYYADAAWKTEGMAVFNSRTATFGAVAVALAVSAWLFRRQAERNPQESAVMAVASGAAHVLLMVLIGVEVFRWHKTAEAPLLRQPGVYDQLRDLEWARDAMLAAGLAVYGLVAVGCVAVLRRAFHHGAGLAAFAACGVVLAVAEDHLPELKFVAGWNSVGATFAAVAACLAAAAAVSRDATPESPSRRGFAIAYELLALGAVLGLYLTELTRAEQFAASSVEALDTSMPLQQCFYGHAAGGQAIVLSSEAIGFLWAAGFTVMAGLTLLRGLWILSLAHRIAGLLAMAIALVVLAVLSFEGAAPVYQTILWQPRGVAYLLTIGVMALGAVGYARRLPQASTERRWTWPILAILAHLLVLGCFTLEAEDFWAARAQAWFPNEELHAWYARHATLSVGYALYAFVLLAAGIRRRSAMLRVLALLILGGTLGKVMLLDLSRLEAIWRILSLGGLGLLLLAASFLYYKYRHMIFGAGPAASGGKESSNASVKNQP